MLQLKNTEHFRTILKMKTNFQGFSAEVLTTALIIACTQGVQWAANLTMLLVPVQTILYITVAGILLTGKVDITNDVNLSAYRTRWYGQFVSLLQGVSICFLAGVGSYWLASALVIKLICGSMITVICKEAK